VIWDAVVVGAGPNGLAAAIELARSGLGVLVLEGAPEVGGSARTAELTLPGFLHDVGSAVHPLGVASPFLSSLPLADHGLEWLHPDIPVAHALDGGAAVPLHRSLEETAAGLGGQDAAAYRRLMDPLVRLWPDLVSHVLDAPLRPPRNPVLMARFAHRALRSAESLARSAFRGPAARALLAGNAAHSTLPLDHAPSAAIGLVLMAAGHAVGWPSPRGGAGALTGAMVSYLRSLGGTVETGHPVSDLRRLPASRAVLLALTARQVVAVAGGALPAAYARRLERWRYAPGAFKVDWALDGPIPWEAEACRRAGTVHLGGTLEEVAASEAAAWTGGAAPFPPFVLLAQPTLFDPTRAPPGVHVAWAYCHVPNGAGADMTGRIEAQVERFAPGFRQLVRARRVHAPADLEAWNPNLVGGDVSGGAPTLAQTFARPVLSATPWATPVKDLYLCSASTPPGGGVHGMCGYHAARTALRRTFGRCDASASSRPTRLLSSILPSAACRFRNALRPCPPEPRHARRRRNSFDR
jgi:phytoene dehydrogenase-like protein